MVIHWRSGHPGEESTQTTITNGTTASTECCSYSSGAVYIYKRTGGDTWAQEAYLKTTNHSHYNFGTAVSLDGNTLAVGIGNDKSNQTTISKGRYSSADTSLDNAGAVQVFSRVGTSWTQEAYIKSSNIDAHDYFGGEHASRLSDQSVRHVLDGTTLVVGTHYEDSNQTTITNGSTSSTNNSSSSSGAVFVYLRE